MSTRTRNAAKGSTKKSAATPKQAKKVAPVEQLKTPAKTQKSIRVHANLDRLPKGNGGVRFKEVPAKDESVVLGTFYVDQASWALLGKSEKIVATLTVG